MIDEETAEIWRKWAEALLDDYEEAETREEKRNNYLGLRTFTLEVKKTLEE